MLASTGDPVRNKPASRLAAAIGAAPRPLELGVIVPTFKEAPNIAPLLAKLEVALRGIV